MDELFGENVLQLQLVLFMNNTWQMHHMAIIPQNVPKRPPITHVRVRYGVSFMSSKSCCVSSTSVVTVITKLLGYARPRYKISPSEKKINSFWSSDAIHLGQHGLGNGDIHLTVIS